MDDLDHRNLGVKLKLWHLQEDAPGMVFWHPRGYAVYRVLEDYVRRKMRRAGYAEVRTPQLLPKELWATPRPAATDAMRANLRAENSERRGV
jgi:threonyl-tRNA synthetase